jgi:hypothetical protein
MVMNVPGLFWLLYSAVIQPAERLVLEIRTSSISPLKLNAPKAAAIEALGLEEVAGDAATGPAISDPSLYNLRFDPSKVPAM